MTNLHLNLWAKSRDEYHKNQGEPLVTHSIQAALTARQICHSLPFPKAERETLAEILVEACAYHDLGKAASGFQHMLRTPANRGGRRHETLSTVLAFALNPNLDPCARFAILTHHRNNSMMSVHNQLNIV